MLRASFNDSIMLNESVESMFITAYFIAYSSECLYLEEDTSTKQPSDMF
jgi:hypothetical protein